MVLELSELTMKQLLISVALLGLFGLPASGSSLFPASRSHMAVPSDEIIQVKKKWKHYKGSPGRKVGWRGRGMPPGQYKKYYRW
jgi:hypothetical protein